RSTPLLQGPTSSNPLACSSCPAHRQQARRLFSTHHCPPPRPSPPFLPSIRRGLWFSGNQEEDCPHPLTLTVCGHWGGPRQQDWHDLLQHRHLSLPLLPG